MRLLMIISLLLCVPFAAFSQQKGRKLFPYNYTIDDLPNGLRLITVPTDYPNLVSFLAVVQTGSRNEIEPGKSGYAHFFEHLMFRGSQNYTPEQRDSLLKRAGAEANATTFDDKTIYYETFSKEDLDQVMQLEADRFQRLKYSSDVFKTESRAILGEYNKNSASPFSKLYEVLRATAFKTHTYAHTTMGFIQDIEDFPNQYDYSLEFYQRYYRPEYTTIVLVGDITRENALLLTKKYFGDWKRGNYVPKIPAEPEQTEARTAHIDWPSQTLPHMVIAFRGPAFSVEKKDKAALDLLLPIAFGENSDLYQRLVLKEQKIDLLSPSFDDQKDPELFAVFARIKDSKDIGYVRDQILATFKRYTTEKVPQQQLDDTRSRLRYGFALSMNSSTAISRALISFVALTRTPESIDQVFALYDQITPDDIRETASRYFVDKHLTVVTLATKSDAKTASKEEGR
ncbi:MAG TPA: pitrilysin family protein [Pyrinomonadaceae bacterium]